MLMLLGITYLVLNKIKRPTLFKGRLFSNMTKVVLFLSDTSSYVPVKLCRIAGTIHLFRISGRMITEDVKI